MNNSDTNQAKQLNEAAVMQSVLAKDLRLGNLIKQGEIKSFYENGAHVGFGKCYNFKELEPIALTEEWLLKLGFEKRNNPYKWYKWLYNDESEKLFILWEKRELFNNNLIGYYCEEAIINMDNVHQLQNLYFALTGSELTVA